jgi:electron transfer flavoprotein alpha subunit
MTALVLLDHDGSSIKQPARSAVAAASKLGEVHALVAGHGARAAAEAAARLPGVSKVIYADNDGFAHGLAEPMAALLVALAPGYTHLLAAATASGKNVMPRAAALLDAQPISDIAGVIDADTFVRPIYAGNALATVRSSDAKKIITVRAASFDPVATEGGNASIEEAPAVALPTIIASWKSLMPRSVLAASCSGAHIASISPRRAPISMARSTERFQT